MGDRRESLRPVEGADRRLRLRAEFALALLPTGTVLVDQSSDQIRIVKDEGGDYEVVDSRRATELGPDPPMLRVSLRRIR